VDASRDAERTAGTRAAAIQRLRPIAKILILDVAAPLVTYGVLRSNGVTTVLALVLSGAVPALGVAAEVIRHRRLEVVGALVLAGIAVGTVFGLVSHNARLVLMEGSVPTAVLGVACLGSLWTRRPLMFGFGLDFVGRDTPQGREMISNWQYEEFRRIFRIITGVWGAGFLFEAAVRVVIVYGASTGTALASSKVTPFICAAVLSAWTYLYAAHLKKKGQQQAAANSVSQASGTDSEPAGRGDTGLGDGQA